MGKKTLRQRRGGAGAKTSPSVGSSSHHPLDEKEEEISPSSPQVTCTTSTSTKPFHQQGLLLDDVGDDEEPYVATTAWQVVKGHFLFWALLLFGIPYGIFFLWRWVVLQHPLSGMRPAVRLQDPRQVLILGSMSSGTSSTADVLRRERSLLEVGHEDSDTEWKFVRDGTVSWFHGIRYFPSVTDAERHETILKTCAVSWFITSQKGSSSSNYGVAPTLFGNPDYECGFWHPNFRTCFLKSCHKALDREYGCALENNKCVTPYKHTLLQTREPWKIVASLAAKYCLDAGGGQLEATLPRTFSSLLHTIHLIPNITDSCPSQMIDYVLNYYTTILDHAPPSSDDSTVFEVYPIERTSPCEIARLAGLGKPETTLYAPNHETYQEQCGDDVAEASKESISKATRSNVINKGRVSIEDLLPFASKEQVKGMKRLYRRLGYEYTH